MLARHQSELHQPYAVYHPSQSAPTYAPPEGAPPPSPTSDANRSHLHYRDQGQWASANDVLGSSQGSGEKDKLQHEEEELARALEASKRLEDDEKRQKVRLPCSHRSKTIADSPLTQTNKENEDLRAALAESTALARQNPSLAAQEQAELSKALLASQRQILLDSNPSRPPRSSARPPTTEMSRSSSSTSLEESEWALRARSEKGSLWSEAGAHGWLPPGASRGGAGGEEERELEMLELAIRISLEEEEERKARESEALAARPALLPQDTGFSSYATAPEIDSVDSHSDRAQGQQRSPATNTSPPHRRVPPPPISHIITAPLSPPTSPYVGSEQHRHQDGAPPLPPNPYHSSPTSAKSTHAPPPLPSRIPPSPPPSEFSRSPNPSSSSGHLEPPHPAGWTGTEPEGEQSRSGSPYEMPFLTSSPSVRRLSPGQQWSSSPSSPAMESSEQSHDTAGHSSWDHAGSTPSSGSQRSRTSTTQQLPTEEDEGANVAEEDPLEALTVRNPDSTPPSSSTPQPPSRALPPPPSLLVDTVSTSPPLDPAFPPFESQMTGRSLSLVSEATEPPSPASTGADSARLLSGHGLGLAASPPVQSPTLMQALQSEPPEFPVHSQEGEIVELPPQEQEAEQQEQEHEQEQTTFGDGVRFGYPQACTHEEDHACSLDGLRSSGPFPHAVVLSSAAEGEEEAERSAFSVEAASWAGLLRFLMWWVFPRVALLYSLADQHSARRYGETSLSASPADVAASPLKHCDAALSLSFRHDDLGASILRLTISLLPPTHDHSSNTELTIASPPSALGSNGKGKGKARAPTTAKATTYLLPDHLVLPTRLSSTAHTLYSLRHLAQIALSTQPSKNASPSYHALRSLAQSIQQLALGAASGGGERNRGQEDLVGRLKERLRRMRGSRQGEVSGGAAGGSGGGGTATQGTKLVKIPPQSAMERTTAVRRRDRVLSAEVDAEGQWEQAAAASGGEEETTDLRDEQEAAGEQERVQREGQEQRRREQEQWEDEAQYLPTLSRGRQVTDGQTRSYGIRYA